jgi:hypothetical protein
MLIIIEWSIEAFDHPASLRTLAATVADHEVVLVTSYRGAEAGVVSRLTEALPRRQIVALLVDGEVPVHERELIEDLLNEGRIPLLLVMNGPAPAPSMTWLRANATIALPAGAQHRDRRSAGASPTP